MSNLTKITDKALHSEIKLCKNCKFCKISTWNFILGNFTYEFAKCIHPELRKIINSFQSEQLVDDKIPTKYYDYYLCSTMRNHDCGADGSFFEPKR